MDKTEHLPATQPRNGLMRRILMFPLVRIVVGSVWVTLPVYAGQELSLVLAESYFTFQTDLAYLFIGLVFAALSIVLYAAFVRLVERRAPTEVALDKAVEELVVGLVTGAVLVSVIVGVLWLAGNYRPVDINDGTSLSFIFGLVGAGAVIEEVLTRGILFRIVEESFGTITGLLISSLIFGVLHLGNPAATWYSSAAVALEGGLMLGAAYTLTRRLWLAIGIHMAWNFVQVGIFGTPVSGFAFPGLIRATFVGPDWLTGGEFGIETSAITLAVSLVVFAVMIAVAAQRGKVKRSGTRSSSLGSEPENSQ